MTRVFGSFIPFHSAPSLFNFLWLESTVWTLTWTRTFLTPISSFLLVYQLQSLFTSHLVMYRDVFSSPSIIVFLVSDFPLFRFSNLMMRLWKVFMFDILIQLRGYLWWANLFCISGQLPWPLRRLRPVTPDQTTSRHFFTFLTIFCFFWLLSFSLLLGNCSPLVPPIQAEFDRHGLLTLRWL